MFPASPNTSVFRVVGFLARQEWAAGAVTVRNDEVGVDVGAVAEHGHALADAGQAGVPPGLASAVLPGTGGAVAITSLVSASMMTYTFAEHR
ncbi:hypothetical protein AMK14_26940 [Streptomyces sp. TSRI0445]|nr:hypothetical protein AMK14_26940 [Streptomyces sp. TSRI0445]